MTEVEQALDEVVDNVNAIAPQHEGFRDLSRLNLTQESQNIVQKTIAIYDRRTQLMEALRSAAVALLKDGYPDIVLEPLPSEVFSDLEDQLSTIGAAMDKLAPRPEASELHLTASDPEPK